jgi:inner membrane protein involved in colicin E2 resistance
LRRLFVLIFVCVFGHFLALALVEVGLLDGVLIERLFWASEVEGSAIDGGSLGPKIHGPYICLKVGCVSDLWQVVASELMEEVVAEQVRSDWHWLECDWLCLFRR